MKKVLIIGASGLIGKALIHGLKGYQIDTFRGRDIKNTEDDRLGYILSGYDIVINLAGKSIFTLWTSGNKKKIFNSRVYTTRKIVDAIRKAEKKPGQLINASAIGIYQSEEVCTENSNTYSNDFMAQVLKAWEKEANRLNGSETDVSILRIGIVLSRDGGAYKTLRLLTKLNVGAVFNGGYQSLSYVCMHDLVNAVDFIIKKKITGSINIVSPNYTTYKVLMKKIKSNVGALILWNLPSIIIKLFLGGTSSLVLKDYKIIPEKLLKNKFLFLADDLDKCLHRIENK